MTVILTPAQNTAVQIQQMFTQNVNMSIQAYQRTYNFIWNPPIDSYTTADLLAAWGTNAASVLAALSSLAAYISAIGGTVPTLSGALAYTANQDGTVTLS